VLQDRQPFLFGAFLLNHGQDRLGRHMRATLASARSRAGEIESGVAAIGGKLCRYGDLGKGAAGRAPCPLDSRSFHAASSL